MSILNNAFTCKEGLQGQHKIPLRHQVKGTRQKGRYMLLISYAVQLSNLKSIASRTFKICWRLSNPLNS